MMQDIAKFALDLQGLGGVLTDALSWEWIFFVNIPVGIVALVLAPVLLGESRDTRVKSFDALGAVLVTGGLSGLVLGIACTAMPQPCQIRALLRPSLDTHPQARIHRFPAAARHHSGALAALPTLDGTPRTPTRRRLASTPDW